MKTVPIPQLTEKDPYPRLMEFYRKLGWNDEMIIKPNLVNLTEKDWLALLSAEIEHAKVTVTDIHELDVHISIGMIWANIGPSGGGQTPGMVELHPGWLEEI
ncbi:MAG: hypothetical protein K6U74_02010 [Firmicutes bacterium]|nr:hypothetical protein [Bacillota bacterium]